MVLGFSKVSSLVFQGFSRVFNGHGSKRCKALGDQAGSIFPFTNRFFWVDRVQKRS